MLQVGSALKGYAIEASDGRIGTVSDFLFDDITWKVRWLVVDTGAWLTGRKVLIHPSAIGQANYRQRELSVKLTKAQVQGKPRHPSGSASVTADGTEPACLLRM